MAYKLLYNDELLFDPYSDNIVTDAQLTSKYNNPDYFDFTVPITNDLYDKLSERSGSVKLFYDNEKIFDGIITSIDIDMDGNKSVKCSGPLDYLNDTLVRPYATTSGESQTLAPNTVSGIFQWYIDQHNQHTMDPRKHFSVGVNQGAMLSENNVFSRKSDSLPTTWNEIKNAILEDHGGFIFVEYSGDSNVLNLYGDIHESNAQIIDFGVNITDFSKTTDTSDQYTAIRPSGYTPEAPENDSNKKMYPITISDLPDNPFDSDLVKKGDIIYSISAVKRYGYKEYAYSNNDITDTNNLLKSAAIILKTLISPAETITVKAVDLALYMNGYKHLRVGQAVRIRSKLHSTDEYMMVNSIVLDINDPSNTEYEFGIPYDTLTGQQSSYLKSLNSSINSAIDSVAGLDQVSKDTAKKAEDAKNTANVAKDTANNASSKADQAQNTANNASSKADQAQNTANSANKAAEELKKKTVEIDKQVESASNAAAAASAKADQVRTDLTNQVQNVKSEMDTAVEAAQTSANKAQSAADAAQKAADKANASTANLDKSIQAVDAKAIAAKQAAAEAQSKAENVASDLDSANAVIEQHTTELGELTTKVSNAVKKSDSALSVSTEAKQTATEASTTATSAYKDSQTALTQSTTATQTATAAKTTAESASKTASDSLKQSSAAVQTANQISTTLRTEYQTKADADKIYATQSSLKQTSDSITASVSKTYATKDALSALQNIADNAIESWRGTGVPTLENKPASDWTTNDDKKKHSGDLYYDKSTGKAYRFGSDDGVTYTWELNQDTDVTKALEDASKAQTSANNAQASATAANAAASKAQSTANTAVSNAATAKNAADAAQSSANKAQGDVDKLKVDIPETYATKSSLTQTAESITANVESVKTTANSAVTAASKAQQTADGISVNLTKNYQTKSQADTLYATKASLKATSDSISAEVTKAQGTADGAVTAASKAQQTADAVTLNLSKNYQTKAQNDALYATQTSLKATSDSLSANITANAKKAQSAVDKATSLEANLNGFKTTVSDTYMAKGIGDEIIENGIPNPDRPNKFGLEIVDGVFQRTFPGKENHIDYGPHEIMHTIGPHRMIRITIDVRLVSGKDTVSDTDYINALGTNVGWQAINVKLKDIVDGEWHSYEKYVDTGTNTVTCDYASSYVGSAGAKVLQFRNASIKDVTSEYKTYSTKSELTQTADSIKAQVTEVSKTANGAMSKATTVEQTANGLSSKITEQAKTLAATTTTANQAKSTADSNKTTISQTANLVNAALAGDNLIADGGFESTEWWKGLKAPFRLSNGSYYHGAHVLVCETATGDNRCPLTHAKGNAGTSTTITVTPGRTYRLSGYCAWLDSVPSNVNPSADKLRLVKSDDTFIAEAKCSKSTSWSETHTDWKCPKDGSITSVKIEVMHQAKGFILWDDVAFRDITEAAETSNRVSSVEQNLNGFKTTVSDTYMAKGIGDEIIENGIPNPDRPNKFGLEIVDGVFQRTFPGKENHIDYGPHEIMHTIGPHRMIRITIDVRLVSGKDTVSDTDYINALGTNVGWQAINVKLKDIVDGEWHSYEKYVDTGTNTVTCDYASSYVGSAGAKVLQFRNASIKDVTSEYKTYSTKSELTQTADSIKAQVTEVSKTANGAMSKATTVEQTANGLSSKITEQAKTLAATTTTANQAKSTADSNKTTISQTANLVNAALAGDNLIADGGFESTEWWKGLKAPFRLSNGSYYHGAHVLVCETATGDNRCPLTHAKGNAGTSTTITVTPGRTYRLSGYCAWLDSVPSNVNPSADKLRLVKSDDTFIAEAKCSKSTSWSETHTDWKCPKDGSITSVKIEVMHQAKGFILWDDVAFRDITEAAETSNRVSSVEQNLNGFKTTVSETYTTKTDFNDLAVGGRNLLLKTSVPTIVTGSGAANQCVAFYSLAVGSLKNLPVGMYHMQFKIKSDTAGGTALAQWNTTPWSVGSSTRVNIGTTEKTYSVDYYITNNDYPNAKQMTVRLDNAKGEVTIREMKLEKGTKPTDWSPAPEDLQPAGDYSTKSYVDQTAKSVALGVVQNYKGSDGSGLATKSDITASEKSITSTVSSTYATKSGVTQEISSKITQNNNSLDIKFATKTENQKAQNAANTANSNATNAQSRVGNIEDCISLTSNGVRAGKRSNGKFTGVSALVNTEGSFDLLDAYGILLTRIDQHTFYVAGDNGVGSGYITLSQEGINITVTPGSDTKQTYHIQIGKDGISLTSPDGTHMNCSAATGMDLETRRWGKLALGPGGMQYTDGNDCGFKLGVSGWSIKWPGNHLLATGPTAGKLYIDGHEIVTR